MARDREPEAPTSRAADVVVSAYERASWAIADWCLIVAGAIGVLLLAQPAPVLAWLAYGLVLLALCSGWVAWRQIAAYWLAFRENSVRLGLPLWAVGSVESYLRAQGVEFVKPPVNRVVVRTLTRLPRPVLVVLPIALIGLRYWALFRG
jgi:hypothetical protein